MSERQTKKKLWKPPTRKSQDTLGSFRRRAFWLEDTTQPSLGAFFSFDEEWLERSATCWEIGDKFYAQECREQAKFIARLRDLGQSCWRDRRDFYQGRTASISGNLLPLPRKQDG